MVAFALIWAPGWFWNVPLTRMSTLGKVYDAKPLTPVRHPLFWRQRSSGRAVLVIVRLGLPVASTWSISGRSSTTSQSSVTTRPGPTPP